jgi:hypothetical protein
LQFGCAFGEFVLPVLHLAELAAEQFPTAQPVHGEVESGLRNANAGSGDADPTRRQRGQRGTQSRARRAERVAAGNDDVLEDDVGRDLSATYLDILARLPS